MEALFIKRDIPHEEIYRFLEFVAIATICDVVSLTDENRVFVIYGLERLNHSENKGLRLMLVILQTTRAVLRTAWILQTKN